MKLVLDGVIKTPVITKKLVFPFTDCKAVITSPRRRYYSKINSGKPMFPYSYECYLGNIQLRCKVKNRREAKAKLAQLLVNDQIGKFKAEGMGMIEWLGGEIITREKAYTPRCKRKIRIRKGLPHDLSESVKELLQYALLHDFFHCDNHISKIYVEPEMDDDNLVKRLKRHHDKHTSGLIKTFQKYDRMSAIITRRARSPRPSRYNWRATKNVDFKRLAREIKEVSNNIWKLYEYIYQSKELEMLNESLQYGHSSLREHVLTIANLIVQDYQKNVLE